MKYENERLGCSFEVPDRPTVRQQLEWYGEMAQAKGKDQFVRHWEAAKTLISGWECAALPDPKASLDQMTNPSQTQVVIWAGTQVLMHMNRLEDVPKN